MNEELRKRIVEKEQAYLDRKAGKPMKEKPIKKYWWETEEEGGQ